MIAPVLRCLGPRPAKMDHQRHAMQPAPQDEGAAGSVPETAEKHGDHQIAHGQPASEPVAAERNIQIIPQPM